LIGVIVGVVVGWQGASGVCESCVKPEWQRCEWLMEKIKERQKQSPTRHKNKATIASPIYLAGSGGSHDSGDGPRIELAIHPSQHHGIVRLEFQTEFHYLQVDARVGLVLDESQQAVVFAALGQAGGGGPAMMDRAMMVIVGMRGGGEVGEGVHGHS
jgi:hypothetical protein